MRAVNFIARNFWIEFLFVRPLGGFLGRWASSTEPFLGFYRKRVTIYKLAGNEVYCTNALLLLIKIMLCSKFYCQIFLICNSSPIRSLGGFLGWLAAGTGPFLGWVGAGIRGR